MGCALHFAVEGVGHPGVGHLLRLMVPQLLLRLTLDLWHRKLHNLRDQLTLLPGDWLTGVLAGPHLIKGQPTNF